MAFSFFPSFKLNDLLASNASADEEDVLNVKRRLNALGHYQSPIDEITSMSDHGLFAGIKNFQRENKLTVDGYMKPGGETEHALNQAIADRPQPDPAAERREAVIAFAGKYGIPEDKARQYMAQPSIFKISWPGQPNPASGEAGSASSLWSLSAATSASAPAAETKVDADTGSVQQAANTHARPRTSFGANPQSAAPQPTTAALKPTPLMPQQQADADYSATVRDGVARYKQYDTARQPPFQPTLPVLDPKAAPKPPPGWNDVVKALQEDLTTPKVSQSLATINFLEGGTGKNPDHSSTAAGGGFLQNTLDNMRNFMKTTNQDPVKTAARERLRAAGIDKVSDPKYLNGAQSVALAKSLLDADLYRVGGHEAVEMINNDQAAAALLDTLFRHGGPAGIQTIQRAINQVRPRSVAEDGIMGSETFKLYQQLADDPDAWRLLGNVLAEERGRTAWQEDVDNKLRAEKKRRKNAKTYRPEDDDEIRRGIKGEVAEGDYKRFYYFTRMERPGKRSLSNGGSPYGP